MKDKDMTCNWVGYLKMKPIDVDELFNRKSLDDETYLNLKNNEPTGEPVKGHKRKSICKCR